MKKGKTKKIKIKRIKRIKKILKQNQMLVRINTFDLATSPRKTKLRRKETKGQVFSEKKNK